MATIKPGEGGLLADRCANEMFGALSVLHSDNTSLGAFPDFIGVGEKLKVPSLPNEEILTRWLVSLWQG